MGEIQKGIYKHYKGKMYLVLGEVTHSETMGKMVLYIPLYGAFRMFVRPKDMFLEEVTMPEYDYTGPRFLFVGKE
ncbi:MAG: DUF1653 domain-containing protein [Candidatus Ryanbacteria bacterium CG10_big_fil_rev_8_21_14_0_10_43_42]|uniref:DUF1653 domain-containing protein n=1 Tax=Candidatus Ryanbacteria bacterium CG10_big_fil_rev_8_21_14_0_10_43_42 TaxID=1974864 RepID=A0A2M8KYF2_9BACT|nr:MAG: DUF1653 domain-containing protein [Candidatus Ryanbacteria bacterium CG10_big_fil_rev_8_21_14_0_10_43_42]